MSHPADADAEESVSGNKPLSVSSFVWAELTDRKKRAEIRLGRRVTYSEVIERMLEATREVL